MKEILFRKYVRGKLRPNQYERAIKFNASIPFGKTLHMQHKLKFVSRIYPAGGGGYRRYPWLMKLAENESSEV